MKYKILPLASVLLFAGCATTGTSTTATNLTNFGYEVANYLQEFNTGAQGALPTVDAIIAALSKQDSTVTKDQNYVAIASTILNAASAAAKAATASGATTAQTQATVSAVLAPATVQTVVANVTSPTS